MGFNAGALRKLIRKDELRESKAKQCTQSEGTTRRHSSWEGERPGCKGNSVKFSERLSITHGIFSNMGFCTVSTRWATRCTPHCGTACHIAKLRFRSISHNFGQVGPKP